MSFGSAVIEIWVITAALQNEEKTWVYYLHPEDGICTWQCPAGCACWSAGAPEGHNAGGQTVMLHSASKPKKSHLIPFLEPSCFATL